MELKGCIITLDAMGCQRKIAKQIRSQKGDYVMGLKGNQSSLHDAVADYFNTVKAHQFRSVPHAYTEESDKDHGWLEKAMGSWVPKVSGSATQGFWTAFMGFRWRMS